MCKQISTGYIRQLSVINLSSTATTSHQSSQQRIGLVKTIRTDINDCALFGGCFILSEIIRTISGKRQLTCGNEFNDQENTWVICRFIEQMDEQLPVEILVRDLQKFFEQPIHPVKQSSKFCRFLKTFFCPQPVGN